MDISSGRWSFWAVFFACLCTAVGLQQYSVWCSTGITHDSVEYLAAARSLATRGELLLSNGRVYTHWTPLFPAFLSLAGAHVLDWIGVMNGLLLAGSISIFSWLARVALPDLIFRVFYMLALALNVPLLLIHAFVWSEPLFLLLLAVHYLFMHFYLKAFSVRFLLGMAFCGFLFCLQRNVGIFFVLGTTAAVLWYVPKVRYTFLAHALIYAVLAASGWLVWSVRNARLLGASRFHAVLDEDLGAFVGNLILFLDTGTAWLLPLALPWWVRLLMVAVAAFLLLWGHIRAKPAGVATSLVGSLALTTGVYLLIMSLTQVTNFTEVERYLAVVYPAILLVLLSLLNRLYGSPLLSGKQKSVFVILLAVSLLYPFARTVNNVFFWHQTRCASER